MRTSHALLLAVALAAAGAAAGYRYAQHAAQDAATTAPATAAAPAGDRKVLYWYDPMYPATRFDKPGKSPFMDMQLVPRYADEAQTSAGGGVSIDPRMAQNLGVRTVAAETATLERRIEAVGSVAWNERGVVVLQARTGGFVEKALCARAARRGRARAQPLVELLVPEWNAAQEEYLALLRSRRPRDRRPSRRARAAGCCCSACPRRRCSGSRRRRSRSRASRCTRRSTASSPSSTCARA